METIEPAARPVLRWAGSKKQLLPRISEYWDESFTRYVEPFCGSASLFFTLSPAAALLSDLNSELIDTLGQIQTYSDHVAECLARLQPDKASYYEIRAQDPSGLSPNERAARFLYLNHHCFNGLYRVNKQGRFNVPYGSKIRKQVLTAAELRQAGKLLQNATLRCSDFQDILEGCGYGDFVYLDPPYASSSIRSTFIEYGSDGFSEMDIGRLFESLHDAATRGVKFVLSYAAVPDLAPYTANYSVVEVDVRRNIAGFAGARRHVRELLITNFEVSND